MENSEMTNGMQEVPEILETLTNTNRRFLARSNYEKPKPLQSNLSNLCLDRLKTLADQQGCASALDKQVRRQEGKLIEQFAKQRLYFLRAALMEAMKWCAPPEQLVEGKRSDQFWLRVFSSPSSLVTGGNVRNFLIAYRLARQGQWDHQAIATRIVNSREPDGSDIRDIVRGLAKFLSNSVCRVKGNNRQQTSAASKIGFFTKPLCEVYIWDKLATSSARFRDWRRASGGANPPRFDRVYTSPNGGHDYALYSAACAKALAEERACHDFVAAVQEFRAFLLNVGGPMGSQPVMSSSFIERRFLDKLMWCEGQWINASQDSKDEEPT